MRKNEELRHLAQVFGRRIFGYCCNVPDDDLDRLLDGAIPLTGGQRSALDGLVGFLNVIRSAAAKTGEPLSHALQRLRLVDDDRSRLNKLRDLAGGRLPDPTDTDDATRALMTLALEAYPTFLIEADLAEENFPLPLGLGALPLEHPERKAFTDAVMQDDALAQLFPEPGATPLETTSDISSTTGSGGTAQLWLLPTTIISSAWRLSSLRGKTTVEDFLESCANQLAVLRKAASGERAEVPIFVGFNNVVLEEGRRLETPWGLVRNIEHTDLSLLPRTARPSTTGDDTRPLGVVLQTAQSYEITVRRWEPGDDSPSAADYWPPGTDLAREGLDRSCERLALAFALGVERTPPVGAMRVWTMACDPLRHPGVSWRSRTGTPVSHHAFGKTEGERVAEWTARIQAVNDQKIEIGIRRFVSALVSRDDPTDGLIDIVIAWENLFGSREGELSFRISSAMACLLEREAEKRVDRQRQINKLYRVRSAVVHGDAEPDSSEARELRNEAATLTARCLSRLYADFPELLQQKDRAKRLILTT